MVNIPGRNGRRRRVLNEEVRSASSAHAARQSAVSNEAADPAPRYSDAAGVENHPQITDFVPRRYSTIGIFLGSGMVTVALLGALHYFAPTVASYAGLPTLRPFDLGAPGSIAAWVSAVVLFVASAGCLLVYSIRRHRIDDFKGRYRVWLGASLACLVLSASSIGGLHQVIANSLSHFTGWTALRDGAAWWLVIAGLPLAWIGLRAMLDVKECRLAAACAGTVATCYAAAASSYFGMIAATEQHNASLITGASLLLGHWLLLGTVVTYARFVILDAQGLVTVRRPAVKKESQNQGKAKTATETKAVEPKPTVLSVVNYARSKAANSDDTEEDDDRWVDGRRPERKSYDSYDEEDEDSGAGAKLSKADRKRLRKLKAQNRAA